MLQGGSTGSSEPKTGRKTDQWTHRQAIQMVAQLPDDMEAALAVLERARQLLLCWDGFAELLERPQKPILVKG